MAAGFFRMETYGFQGHGSKKNRTFRSVIQEASRTRFFRHVTNPKKPIALVGNYENLYEIQAEKIRLAKNSGLALRKDAQLMIGIVISYPHPVTEMKKSVDEWKETGKVTEMAENYQKFRSLSLYFLEEEWNDRFVCALEHWDEEYPHIHAYVFPKFDRKETMMDIHPGKKAFKENAAFGRKIQHVEYRKAMNELQERFYEKVSIPLGWTKGENSKRRISRTKAVKLRDSKELPTNSLG